MATTLEVTLKGIDEASRVFDDAAEAATTSMGTASDAVDSLDETITNVSDLEIDSSDAESAMSTASDAADGVSGAIDAVPDLEVDAGSSEAAMSSAADAADSVSSSVDAVPDLEVDSSNAQASIESATEATDGFGEKSGSILDKVKEHWKVLAGAAGIGAVGKALFNIGGAFAESSDAIVAGTGASGSAMASMGGIADEIATKIPVSFGQAGEAIANVNTITGMTGDNLKKMTTSVLDASRVLGEDGVENSVAFSKSLQQWGVDADDSAGKAEKIFYATQKYGLGFGETSQMLNTYSAALQGAGFSMDESIALFGQLNKSGLDVGRMMPGLKRAFKTWAEEGKNPQEMLKKTVKQLENTDDATARSKIATEAFGQSAGPMLVAAVKSGAFELKDLDKQLDKSGGSLDDASERTSHFKESWTLLKNKGMLLVKPVAIALFDALSDGAEVMSNKLIPAVKTVFEFMADHETTFKVAAGIITGIFIPALVAMGAKAMINGAKTAAGWVLSSAGASAAALVSVAASAAIGAKWVWSGAMATASAIKMAAAWVIGLGPIAILVAAVVAAVILIIANWDKIGPAISAVWEWIKEHVFTPIGNFFTKTIPGWVDNGVILIGIAWTKVQEILMAPFRWLKTNVLNPIGHFFTVTIPGWIDTGVILVKTAWTKVQEIIKAPWTWVKTNILYPLGVFFKTTIPSWVSTGVGFIKTTWHAIQEAIAAPYRWIRTNVFDKLATLIKTTIPNAFEKGVGFIKTAWKKLEGYAKSPIEFIVDTVYNKGIVPLWNKVAGVFGAKTLDPFYMATGGPVSGPGTSTSDSIPTMLSNKEHVWSAAEVAGAGGHTGVEGLRAMAKAGDIPAFKDGGFWGNLKAGAKAGLGMSTTGQAISAAGGFAEGMMDPMGWLKDKFSGLTNGIGSSKFAQMLAKLPVRVLEWAKKKFGSLFSFGAGGDGGGRHSHNGATLDGYTLSRVKMAEAMLGRVLNITQGSFSNSVAASGSTHSGGGAIDVMMGGLNQVLAALRASGFAAWIRSPSQGPWPTHIHAIALGDPLASASAKGQMQSYLSGGNGLGGYKDGTRSAQRGLHLVGEEGVEAINFGGGESVTPLKATRAPSGRNDQAIVDELKGLREDIAAGFRVTLDGTDSLVNQMSGIMTAVDRRMVESV